MGESQTADEERPQTILNLGFLVSPSDPVSPTQRLASFVVLPIRTGQGSSSSRSRSLYSRAIRRGQVKSCAGDVVAEVCLSHGERATFADVFAYDRRLIVSIESVKGNLSKSSASSFKIRKCSEF